MGDVKNKSSAKALKGRAKKTRAKNYIRENVKKLRQMQNERPKPQEEMKDHRDQISYADRLKAVTSPHIKMVQKICLLKENRFQHINEKKKESVANIIKTKVNQFNEINTHIKSLSPSEIQIKKSTKPLIRLNERPLNEEKKYSSMVEMKTPQVTENEPCINMRFKPNPYMNAKLNKDTKEMDRKPEDNRDDNKKLMDKMKDLDLEPDKDWEDNKTQIGKCPSESRVAGFPKAFKNEGCQAKPSNSLASIDSTTVVRFPRNVNAINRRMSKKVCEKSLQTDNSKQSSSISKDRNRSPKKLTASNKKVISPTEVKVADLHETNLNNNTQLNAMVSNAAKITPTSLSVANNNTRNNKFHRKKRNPTDEKANMILNDLISASNVDIKKLFNEITRVQKTSPFARHHTVFEKRSPEEIKNERDSYLEKNPNRIPGTIELPDHKRREYLAQIKTRHGQLLQQLNSMPLNTKSTEARQKKLQLGRALESMDSAIRLFSKNHLFLDLNPSN